MQAHDGTKKNTPHNPLPAAKREKNEAGQGDGNPVPFADECVELVFAEVWDIRQKSLRMIVHDSAGHDPAHVGPEPAIARRMGISLYISVLVMHPVSCHPEKRAAFQGQRAAGGQKIFQPLMSFVTAMCKQAV